MKTTSTAPRHALERTRPQSPAGPRPLAPLAAALLLAAPLAACSVVPSKGDWESQYTTGGDRDTFSLDEDQEGKGRWRSFEGVDTTCDVNVKLKESGEKWELRVDATGPDACAGKKLVIKCKLDEIDKLECDSNKDFRNVD